MNNLTDLKLEFAIKLLKATVTYLNDIRKHKEADALNASIKKMEES